jgi:EmrB/QacA subfamily drug resistance transporter
MAVLDVAIVNVAIPSIREDLQASFGEVQLVISAYTLTYASLLVTGGRLGDLFGRKRMFMLGLALFSVASAACGLAPSAGVLIGARAVQGIGGAMLYPQVLAIVQLTFDGDARTRALGIFGSVAGIAAVAGQVLGGMLLALDVFGLGWRPTFLVNVPLGVLAIVAALAILPPDEHERHGSLDLGGVVLTAATLALLIVPLVEGRELGWPLWTLLSLGLSLIGAAAFFAYERRISARGGSPLVRLDLFRNAAFASGVPIAALFTASYAGFLLLLAVYLQVGLGFSPLQAGLTYTPAACGFFLASLGAPRLVPLLGRHVLTVGYVIAAFGLSAAAATAAAAGGTLAGWQLAPSLFVAGVGQGLGMSPLVGTIIGSLEARDAGSGAGVITTTLQVGNALGVALIGLIFFGVLGTRQAPDAYAMTFAGVLPVSAGLLAVAALLVSRMPHTPGEAANALIERLPGWAEGFAYSMFLMTGGRMADPLFHDILGHVTERRLQRTQAAPAAPGEFFAFHFDAAGEDRAWLHYLMREALAYGTREIPHESDRLPVIQAQVDEIRRRQAAGLLPDDLDPALLRLFAFALASYPRILPQITRMTTGLAPDDPRFVEGWENLLRRVGSRLERGSASPVLARQRE